MNSVSVRVCAGLLAISAAAIPPSASAAEIGIGVNAGTLGAGLDVGFGLPANVVGRVGFNSLTLDEDFEEDGIDYSADLELESVHALADWHVLGGGFRITGGIIFNGNAFDGDAGIDPGDQIGGGTALSSGSLGLDVEYDDAAPYLGIGWGNRVRGWSKVSFGFDAGVMLQGTPDVELTNNGVTGISQSDLDQEEKDIEDELEEFEVYPVISASIIFRF